METLTLEDAEPTGEPTERRQKPWPRYEQAVLGLRHYWYPALFSRQLQGKPVGVKMLSEELVFVRHGGRVYCLEGRCKHRGVALTAGRTIYPCTISCAYHGWTYSLETGELLAALTDGPESSVVGKVRLRTYPCLERQGIVWAFIGDMEPPPLEADVPPEFLDPNAVVIGQATVGRGNWRLALEGAIDPSHAFFLHRFAWLNTFKRMPAARTQYIPQVFDGRYVGYKGNVPLPEAEYPKIGVWPPKHWWEFSQRRAVTKVVNWLPCGCRVEGNLTPDVTVYSWYVPVDADHYRWFQTLMARVSGPGRWWFKVRYHVWLRWMYQRQFLGQDLQMNELLHPFYAEQRGWERERLYRPDVVITAWRKFVDQNARGVQTLPY